MDSSGNIYVSGTSSDNAFKIATPGTCSTTGTPCTITEIINEKGDRGGNPLNGPYGVAVDSNGDGAVYVAGWYSDNTFKIRPGVEVPSVSNQGLVVLGALLLCVVSWVGRRRRVANA